MNISKERLMILANELIGLYLEVSEDLDRLYERLRFLGLSDDEMRGFGLDVSEE